MTAHAKTPLEHVNDTLAQLKEMRHHSRNHVECLTSRWLLFDGELKKLDHASNVEALMTRQSALHDALEAEIASLEALAQTLQPPPDETGAETATRH